MRVDFDFNFSVLYKFGCGDKFIHMVEDANTNTQSKIKINGLFSDLFTLREELPMGTFSRCCYTLICLMYL